MLEWSSWGECVDNVIQRTQFIKVHPEGEGAAQCPPLDVEKEGNHLKV